MPPHRPGGVLSDFARASTAPCRRHPRRRSHRQLWRRSHRPHPCQRRCQCSRRACSKCPNTKGPWISQKQRRKKKWPWIVAAAAVVVAGGVTAGVLISKSSKAKPALGGRRHGKLVSTILDISLRVAGPGIRSPWALLAAGCGGEAGSEGLSVDVTFAPGVPRAARDEAVRVEVYLVGSCDSDPADWIESPDDPLDSMFVLRDGSAGPAIGIPEPGQYGLYAVAQDSNCAVVGAACDEVTHRRRSPG